MADNLLVTVSRTVSTAAEVSRDFRGVDGALFRSPRASPAQSDSISLRTVQGTVYLDTILFLPNNLSHPRVTPHQVGMAAPDTSGFILEP